MNICDIIRKAIPDASDELCEYIALERTAYPFVNNASMLYHSASSYIRANDNGIKLCELCNNKTESKLCDKCNAIIKSNRK